MRKVIASTFLSLDGIMQAPGGPDEDRSGGFDHGGWIVPYADETTGAVVGELFSRPYELLLGRRTYDIFAAYWPHQEEGGHGDIARQFNATVKYVATHDPAALGWRNSVALSDPVADVARLKRQDGPDLVIQGSGTLIRTLLAAGLIDRFTLLIFPVLLGEGTRLFGPDAGSGALTLVRSQASASGVVINVYEPAGAVKTGSFL